MGGSWAHNAGCVVPQATRQTYNTAAQRVLFGLCKDKKPTQMNTRENTHTSKPAHASRGVLVMRYSKHVFRTCNTYNRNRVLGTKICMVPLHYYCGKKKDNPGLYNVSRKPIKATYIIRPIFIHNGEGIRRDQSRRTARQLLARRVCVEKRLCPRACRNLLLIRSDRGFGCSEVILGEPLFLQCFGGHTRASGPSIPSRS